MSAISSISASGHAWANATAQRSQMQAKMFNKVDADGNGGVDQTELQALFTDISKKTGAVLDAAEQFSAMDSNADGSLNSDELAQGMQSLMPPPPSTMAFAQSRITSGQSGDLFAKVDSNSDGSVDEAEMTAFTDKMKAETGRDSPASFSTLDADGDGSLTQDEFDAGRPSAPLGGADSTQGAGGPPPAGGPGGPGGPGGTKGAESSSSVTYDPLDTNEDGTVSELERLAGALKDFVSASESNDGFTTSVDENLLKLAQMVYEQIAANGKSSSASTLDATA
jgi:Ca2+-binding EF-hand superfamily protein